MKKLLLSLFAVLTASFAMAQTNLLSNGSFEQWNGEELTDWLITASGNNTAGSLVAIAKSTDKHSGTYAVAITNLTADKTGNGQKNGRLATKEMKLKAGTYTFSVCLKAADATGAAARIGHVALGSDGKPGTYSYGKNENGFSAPDTLTTAWLTKTYEFTLSEAATVCLVIMHSKNAIDKTVIADDASLTTTDGGIDDGTEPTPQPQGDVFESALTDTQGNWTIVDVTMPEGATYIWSQSSSYGMKASAYINKTNCASESYLVSPAIVLQEGSVLTFDHVQRFAANAAEELTLWIRENGATEWAAQLTIPTFSDGESWNFVSSGNIDLSAYNGKTIQLGFRYTSSEDAAATWEIKNVKVTNAKAAEKAPELKDPSNTPETAYTVAQAIELINNRNGYDMSKEVYTKGVITSIKSLDVSQWVRAQYYIGDTEDAEQTIQVYNGYFIAGTDFKANDQIKVGDEVIVYGKLSLYGTTYEIDQNNYIYSLNGLTDGVNAISSEKANGAIYDLSGRRVEKAVKGIYIMNGRKFVK